MRQNVVLTARIFMGARAKAFFSVAAIGLLVLLFWLWNYLPTQGWAVLDAETERWGVIAIGWSVLWHAWPILAAGVMLGVGLGIGLLGMLFKGLIDADQKHEIEHMQRLVKDAQQREAESLALARKELENEFAKARDLYERAEQMQEQSEETIGKALAIKRAAEAAQQKASQDVEQAQFRARNAICAAERIKRKHLA